MNLDLNPIEVWEPFHVFESRSFGTSDGVSLLREMLGSLTEDQAATFEVWLVFRTRRNTNSLQLINYCYRTKQTLAIITHVSFAFNCFRILGNWMTCKWFTYPDQLARDTCPSGGATCAHTHAPTGICSSAKLQQFAECGKQVSACCMWLTN
jgi:hypothetical protein